MHHLISFKSFFHWGNNYQYIQLFFQKKHSHEWFPNTYHIAKQFYKMDRLHPMYSFLKNFQLQMPFCLLFRFLLETFATAPAFSGKFTIESKFITLFIFFLLQFIVFSICLLLQFIIFSICLLLQFKVFSICCLLQFITFLLIQAITSFLLQLITFFLLQFIFLLIIFHLLFFVITELRFHFIYYFDAHHSYYLSLLILNFYQLNL